MTLNVPLEVRNVSAHMRGSDPTRPVLVGYDGTRVVMVMDSQHAEILAQVLARYEQLAKQEIPDESLDGDTWLHAMVDLLAAKAFAGGTHLHAIPDGFVLQAVRHDAR